jgi:RsiW-degrading membrane proteinase PrsW (M82 family)
MPIIQLALSAIICGILYFRMIRREVPEQIGRAQALAPVGLGVVSLVLSFIIFIGIGFIVTKTGLNTNEMPRVPGSILGAFLLAGLPEEAAKLLIILLTFRIFRSKIRNVYEMILIGAGVGLGFTLFEEFFYGGGGSNPLRLLGLAAHMVFGIIMTRHLAQARYDRMMNQGSPAKEAALAIAVPMLIHTLYDATNATNKFLNSEDEKLQAVGMVIAAVGIIAMVVLQILVIVRFKKNTEKYCGMSMRPQNSGNPDQGAVR